MDHRTRARRFVPPALAALAALAALGCASAKTPQANPETASPAPASLPQARAGQRGSELDGSEKLTVLQKRARMHYQLGVDHLRQGSTPEAIGELLEAERYDPMDERNELALAEAYREQGRLADAETHLLRALQIRPGYHEAGLNLAALYIQTERYEQAIAPLQQLLADPTFPAPWRALTNLGWAEYRLGRLDDAAQHLTLAVDYRPDYWPARLNLGILEADRGKRAEAIQQFEQVLERKPSPMAEAEVRYRLAEQLVSAGDKKGAVRQLTTASNLQPGGGPWSKRSAEYLKTLQ